MIASFTINALFMINDSERLCLFCDHLFHENAKQRFNVSPLFNATFYSKTELYTINNEEILCFMVVSRECRKL